MLETTSSQYTLWEVLERGGWAMVPLVVCSVVALAVVFERLLWGIRRGRVFPRKLLHSIEELSRTGRLDELVNICRLSDSPLARVTLATVKGLSRPRQEMLEDLEIVGRREYGLLQRNIGVLGTIAAIAPLLGLLGTVIGIIRTFSVIEKVGIGNPQLLAGGISEALIATASGICIAVPAVIFYRFCQYRARQLTLELEEFALDLVQRLSPERAENVETKTAGRAALKGA